MKKFLSVLILLLAPLVTWANEDAWAIFEPNNNNSDVELFTIVGDDDREEITGNAKLSERAVVVLQMQTENGAIGYCSGAMIDQDIVLTAAHCLAHNGRFYSSVKAYAIAAKNNKSNKKTSNRRQFNEPVSPIRNNQFDISDSQVSLNNNALNAIIVNAVEETTENQEDLNSALSATAKQMWVPKRFLDCSAENLYCWDDDFGIIILDKPLGGATGWFGINSKLSLKLLYSDILAFGRPGDKEAQTLWKSKGTIGDVWSFAFVHDADTLPGNSGGPIVLKKKPDEIIGIHIAEDVRNDQVSDKYPNYGLRITRRVIKAVNEQRKNGRHYLSADK